MDEVIQKKLDNFFLKYKKVSYKKGTIVIRAGEEPAGVCYLKEGLIKQYAISTKGEELIVNIFKSSAFFPMSWAINKTPNNYFFEAISDISAVCAPRADVVDFIKKNPDVLFDLTARVYKGVDGLLTRMVYLMAGNANSRLIVELIILAKRLGVRNGLTVEIHIAEKDLASQTGMSRETVSREIKVLKEKNLITFEKSMIIVKSLEKLENELENEI